MNQFKDFGIKIKCKTFVGDKIKPERIFNRKIIVHDYKIENSKFEKGSGKCLHLQIELNGTMHICFSGSAFLMEMIQAVPEENFPFETTIIKNDERHEFT